MMRDSASVKLRWALSSGTPRCLRPSDSTCLEPPAPGVKGGGKPVDCPLGESPMLEFPRLGQRADLVERNTVRI